MLVTLLYTEPLISWSTLVGSLFAIIIFHWLKSYQREFFISLVCFRIIARSWLHRIFYSSPLTFIYCKLYEFSSFLIYPVYFKRTFYYFKYNKYLLYIIHSHTNRCKYTKLDTLITYVDFYLYRKRRTWNDTRPICQDGRHINEESVSFHSCSVLQSLQ